MCNGRDKHLEEMLVSLHLEEDEIKRVLKAVSELKKNAAAAATIALLKPISMECRVAAWWHARRLRCKSPFPADIF